ncbi:hypothetical protein Tco_0556372 [Tanacetum coccineum]
MWQILITTRLKGDEYKPEENLKALVDVVNDNNNEKEDIRFFLIEDDGSAAKKEIWNEVMTCRKIIIWRTCLKFAEEPKVTKEARDLICHLLYDVESRLGTGMMAFVFKRDAWEIIQKQVASSKKYKVVNGAVTRAIEKKKVKTKE